MQRPETLVKYNSFLYFVKGYKVRRALKKILIVL